MAVTALDTIKNWFKTHLKPTQDQFWAMLDSFRHKSEKVPVADIEGLDGLLAGIPGQAEMDSKLPHGGYTGTAQTLSTAIETLNGLVEDLQEVDVLTASQITALQTQITAINTLLTSDDVNLDTVQELVDAIKTVETSLSTILVNDLTTGGTTKALTAEMGKTLKGLIDTLTTAVNGKQATLVSGTNIKTINGNSILGSGDLTLMTDVSGKQDWALTNNSIAGVSYTFAIDDYKKTNRFSSATAVAATVPTNASVAIPIGTTITCTVEGAGAVTVGGAGITFVQRNLTFIQGDTFYLKKVATDTWAVEGNIVPKVSIYNSVYLDDTNGNDATAEFYNPVKPFKTLIACINAINAHTPSNNGNGLFIITTGLPATYSLDSQVTMKSFNLISDNNCVFNFNQGLQITRTFVLRVNGTVNFNWTPTTLYYNYSFNDFAGGSYYLEINVNVLCFNNTTGYGFDRGWTRSIQSGTTVLPWKVNYFRIDKGISILGSNLPVSFDFDVNTLELRDATVNYTPGLFSQSVSCRSFSIKNLINNYSGITVSNNDTFSKIPVLTLGGSSGTGITCGFTGIVILTGYSYTNIVFYNNYSGTSFVQILGTGQRVNITYNVTINDLINIGRGTRSSNYEGSRTCKLSNMTLNIIDAGTFLSAARFFLMDIRVATDGMQLILQNISIIMPNNRPMFNWVNAPADATGFYSRIVMFKGSVYIDNGTGALFVSSNDTTTNIPSDFVTKEGSIYHASGTYKVGMTNLPAIFNNSTY